MLLARAWSCCSNWVQGRLRNVVFSDWQFAARIQPGKWQAGGQGEAEKAEIQVPVVRKAKKRDMNSCGMGGTCHMD